MSMLCHGGGAFIPYTTNPFPSNVVMADPSSSHYGTWGEHSPEADELHTCPWLLFVPLAGSSWHLLRAASGSERSRGDCVAASIPWWITAATIPGCRGRLGAVSQGRQLPCSTTTCPQWECRALQLLTCCREPVGGEFRVQSWGNTWNSVPVPVSVCVPNGSTCHLHGGSLEDSQPARVTSAGPTELPLSCHTAGGPLQPGGAQQPSSLHSVGGFGRGWTSSAVKGNSTNHSWTSLARKWLTLISAHSH